MQAQNGAMVYVYDVDGEGGCVMHFAKAKPEGIYVGVGQSVMPPGFFEEELERHQRMGRTAVVELTNEFGTVWSVRIGAGDFETMIDCICDALLKVAVVQPGGGRYGYPN